MKRFIVSMLCATVFFVGLGNLLERASASLKSDDKALELLRKARAAIGGDQAVGGVRSMTITGKAAKTFEVEGIARTENGDFELNFELPNRLNRSLKMGSGEGNVLVDRRVDVVVARRGEGEGDNLKWKTVDPANPDGARKVTIVKKDGTSEEVKIEGREPIILKRTDDGGAIISEDGQTATVDGKKVLIRKADGLMDGEFKRSNELLRTTLSLLATAPEGLDVSYTYVGEGSVDGVSCEIVAANDGSSTLKLFLDKSTSLPRMVSFEGHKPFMIRFKRDDVKTDEETRILERRIAPETAEFQIKFSDFRSVNGLQLPFKWTQTIGGKTDEVLDISAYEINPANIADKFKEERTKVFVRSLKEQ